jgi:hypothetical protein
MRQKKALIAALFIDLLLLAAIILFALVRTSAYARQHPADATPANSAPAAP